MQKGRKVVLTPARRSAAEGGALVEQWRQSGMSISEFCRGHAVGTHVLHYWRSRQSSATKARVRASEFFVVSAPDRTPEVESDEARVEQVETGGSRGSAFIVVLGAASPVRIAETLRALLQESQG